MDVEELAAYIPRVVRDRLAATHAPLETSVADRRHGAVLFVDISGFTPLAEQLARRGPVGAEDLSRLLNASFGRLGALVTASGGDVLGFAGDSLRALWSVTEGRPPDDALVCASQCALAVAEELTGSTVMPGIQLSLRMGLGAGEALLLDIGAGDGPRFLLAAGEAVEQAIVALERARGGEVVVAAERWNPKRLAGEQLSDGAYKLVAVTRPAPPWPVPGAEVATHLGALLMPYVPRPAATTEGPGREWLAELRRVSAIFVNLKDLHLGAPGSLGRLAAATGTVQAVVDRYEGTLLKLTFDDKGLVMVVAFGLPPLAHEDDPERAARAALDIRSALVESGVRCGAGIATGRVFCGLIEASGRREYTVVGDTVNLAARLMEAAGDGIVWDSATQQVTGRSVRYEELPPLSLKGKRERVAVYRPGSVVRAAPAAAPIVGREAERARIGERLRALQDGRGGVILIEGEPGIGKSRFLGDLLDRARAGGMRSATGAGDAIERATPYHGWSTVFGQLLAGTRDGSRDAWRALVMNRLRSERHAKLAPLLNSVLPLDLPENEVTSQMAGAIRAENTNDVIVALLATILEEDGGPLLLVLDDAHWLDSASWSLALLVALRVPNLLLVVARRPEEGDPHPAYARLLELAGTDRIVLGAFSREETATFLRQRLGVEVIPEAVVDLILERAEGNPFFSEELVYSLLDAGVLLVGDGACRLAPGAPDVTALPLPETLEAVVTSRIDRLPTPVQLTLKVASVIGRAFSLTALRGVHPEPDRWRLAQHLDALQRQNLAILEADGADPLYVFKHAITQSAAYNLLLFAQRRQLHGAAASWYEREQPEDPARLYPLLAFHWARAEKPAKAVEYMEKAGEQASTTGAYEEAIHHFRDALATPLEVARVRQAGWERQLGEAHLGLGHPDEGRQHLQRAVKVAGWPEPAARPLLAGRLVRGLIRQVLHRLAPTLLVGRARGREGSVEAARAYIRLVETYWFANDTLPLVHAGVSSLNLAESAGPSPALARAYAIMCLATGSVPLHRAAEFYGRRALETAERTEELAPVAYCLFIPNVYRIGTGQWRRIEPELRRSADVFGEIGDRRLQGDARTVLAMSALYQGDFARADREFAEVHEAGLQNGNSQHQVWGLIGRGEVLFRLGRAEEALRVLMAALALLEEEPSDAEELRAHGLLAAVRYRRGEHDMAWEEAEAARSRIVRLPSATSHYLLEGYAAPAELLLGLWEREGGPTFRHARRAGKAVADLRKYARVFPIGEPRARVCRGLLQWLSGDRGRALASWRRALAASERLGMGYEQARAHYELGRHLGSGEASLKHLSRASKLFSAIGAVEDVARTEGAIERHG